MRKTSLSWGILAVACMVLSFVPCLDCMQWPTILFASAGLAFCGVALAKAKTGDKMSPAVGMGCCAFVILLMIIKIAMDRPTLIYDPWYYF